MKGFFRVDGVKMNLGLHVVKSLNLFCYWQMSIATDTKVFVVIMFDRAARVLFGCSADEFFDFAKTHPYAGMFMLKDFLHRYVVMMKLTFA